MQWKIVSKKERLYRGSLYKAKYVLGKNRARETFIE